MWFFFARKNGKPFVLSTHGSLLGFKKYLSRGIHRLPYQLYDWATLKASAKRANAVVVSSKLEYEDAVEFGISRKKLHIIPMGIDSSSNQNRRKNCAATLLKILFVGRIARVRRVELALQAVKLLSIPFHLTIVGGEEKTSSLAKSGYLNQLKNLCGTLEIADHVTFAGAKEADELESFYREADVFIYPSLYENFGQPILEAAAAGLPVISTPVGIAPEIIQEGKTGFLVSGKPEEISNRLEQLNDADLRTEIGKNIQEKVRRNFEWTQIMEQYLELYRQL